MAEEKQNPSSSSSLYDHHDLLLMLKKLSFNNNNNNPAATQASSSSNLQVPSSSSSFGSRAYQELSQFQYVNNNSNNVTLGFTTTSSSSNLQVPSSLGSEANQESQYQYVDNNSINNNNGALGFTTTRPTNQISSPSFSSGAYQEPQFQYIDNNNNGTLGFSTTTTRPTNLIPSLSDLQYQYVPEHATRLYNNVGYQETRPANQFSPMNSSTLVKGGDQRNSYVEDLIRKNMGYGCFSPYSSTSVANYPNTIHKATMGGNYVSPRPLSYHSTIPSIGGNSYCNRKTFKKFNSREESITLESYLRDSKYWTEEEILKLRQSDPSLVHKLQGEDIVFMARDQFGSKYLQGILCTGNFATVTKILDAVIDKIINIMIDPYGNHVFQKILMQSRFHEVLMQIIVFQITKNHGQLTIAGCNHFGARSILNLLKTLKSLKSPLINNLMLALRPGIKGLMMNNEGRHVINYCVNFLSCDQSESIFMVAKQHCIELARHNTGYLALCDCIATAQGSHGMELLMEITKYSVHFSQEQNANYVLQKVIRLENPSINEIICNKMKDHVAELSTQKHSSFVIEMCLASTSMEIVFLALLELSPRQLNLISEDQFGNYVIQKALNVSKTNHKDLYHSLVKLLMRDRLDTLQYHPTGRNVYNLLSKAHRRVVL